MTRFKTFLGATVTVMTVASSASAQPTITSPSAGQVFRAGPDYATDVLQDPWDFDNIDDVGQYPYEFLGWVQSPAAFVDGPSAFGVGSGKFAATNASSDPGIGLLYMGGIGIPNPGRNGQRFPIETGTYSKLSFRLKATNTPGSPAAVHWHFGGLGSPLGTGSALSAGLVTNGERVYQIDLVAGHGAGGTFTSRSQVVGLRLDPINEASQASIELDWVRLTASDAQTPAKMPIATTCSGAKTVDVLDGVTSTRVLADSGTGGSFNYGIFPSGSYTLRVTCNGRSADVPFVINDPPRVTVLQPDERGGADYATIIRGNPWDMDDAADVAGVSNLDQGGFVPAPDGGVMLRARNVLNPNPSITGDPNLFLLNGEGATRPIASTRYRYLTFTTQLHAPFDLAVGSVARVGWASAPNWDGATAAGTRDILVWPGRNTYTIDLGALTFGDGLEPCGGPLCRPWLQASSRFLRFDPHEFGDRQVVFDLDNVTLAAPDEVSQGGVFPISWNILGAANGSTSLWIDTDRNPGNGRTLIASGLPIGARSHNWTANGVGAGDYFVYVEVTETTAAGNDTRGAYSSGIVKVLPAANSPVVTIASLSPGGAAYAPFNLSGCAYNTTTGGAATEVIAYAHPLQGQMGGVVQLLGYNAPGGLGTLGAAACSSGAGYQVSNIFGLGDGQWMFRVLARNPVTGDFDEVRADNVSVGNSAGPARNLRVSTSGNNVSLAWDPPLAGTVTQYRIEASADPSFSVFGHVVVPPSQTSVSAPLGNGNYFVRVVTGNLYSTSGPPSNVVSFALPSGTAPGPGGAPGAPALTAVQTAANPITLSWAAGAGGAPTSYTLLAGTAPGSSNLGVFPMGLATSVTASAPAGPIYARLFASNVAGNTVSNEISFVLAAPAAPALRPATVSGQNVTLAWEASAGATGYVLVARYAGNPTVILAQPVGNVTSLYIPGAPPGNYLVTVVAVNGVGPSAESNSIAVAVQ